MDKSLKHIDLSYLENMAMGDASTKRRLLLHLQRQLPREMQELQQFIQEEKWRKAQGQLHLLQSTLQFAGCRPMAEALEQLQAYLHRESVSPPVAKALLEVMQAHETDILHELKTVLRVQEK